MAGIKLHLGAFDCAVSGWVNTDITPHMWIGKIPGAARVLKWAGILSAERYRQHRSGTFKNLRYLDLTRPLPFADDSVEAVFSSHVLEHLFADEVERLIRELHRVLKPGGICRVVVPDLEKIVALYDPVRPAPFLDAIYEIGRRSDVKNAHHTGFTGASISALFLEAGFASTSVEGYRVGRCPDLDKLDNRPESLFFEAVR